MLIYVFKAVSVEIRLQHLSKLPQDNSALAGFGDHSWRRLNGLASFILIAGHHLEGDSTQLIDFNHRWSIYQEQHQSLEHLRPCKQDQDLDIMFRANARSASSNLYVLRQLLTSRGERAEHFHRVLTQGRLALGLGFVPLVAQGFT